MSMTQAEYARHAKVHPSTVGRWLESGRISLGPDGRIDPDQADRERLASESPMPHHQARKAQIDAEKERRSQATGSDRTTDQDQTAEALSHALKVETWKLQKAKAETANLELDKAAGLLVERAEVEYLLCDLAAMFQSKLDGMAGQLAPALFARHMDQNAMHAEIESYARDLQAELAAHAERQAKQHLGATEPGPTPAR